MTFAVEADRLSLRYGSQPALQDISFKLESGTICGLLGRNGAGKTSLLALLAAFREPTGGIVRIGGETPFENARVMRNVIFIYQQDYKEESETVKGLLAGVQRYRPRFDLAYAGYLAQKFNLPPDKPAKKLSKGMQSALNVTIGLASRAPVTIFDEAYLGMDAPSREIFYQELLADHQSHPRTIILSTHLVSEMDYLFEQVMILESGALVLHEDYEALTARGASVTGPAAAVDQFVRGRRQLNEKRLGDTKSVMVYGDLSEADRQRARQSGLEVGPVALQDLFIYLTRKAD